MNERFHKFVEVEWDDASASAAWTRYDDAVEFAKSKWRCFTVGVLIWEDANVVCIAGAVNAEGWYSHLSRILKSSIIKIRPLRKTK